METVITGLIIFGVLVLAVLGLGERALSAQDVIAEANRVMQARAIDRAHTDLSLLGVTTGVFGDVVEVTIENTGDTKLADFDEWDVILQYTDGIGAQQVGWYAYATGWTQQVYQVATTTPEAIDPGILNPGEEIVLQIYVSPAVGTGTTNLVVVTTPNGVTTATTFTR